MNKCPWGHSTATQRLARKIHNGNFRWYAQTDRQDGATEPSRHNEMAPIFDDVAIGETIAEFGRHDWRPTHEAYLAAMGVAAEGERHTGRHLGEQVRLMGQVDDGCIIGDLRKGSGKIVTA